MTRLHFTYTDCPACGDAVVAVTWWYHRAKMIGQAPPDHAWCPDCWWWLVRRRVRVDPACPWRAW